MAWGETVRWCAAAPIVTMLPRSGGRAFVTGARTRHVFTPGTELRDGAEDRRTTLRRGPSTGRLVEACERLDLWLDECEAADGPLTLLIACESHTDAEQLARELGIAYAYNVAEQIAGVLPPLEASAAHFRPGALPRGFEAEYFDVETVAWRPTATFDQRGLYRCRTYEGHVHALLDGAFTWRRAVREFAVYEVLRWEHRPVITYSAADFELRVPAEAALPALHARAATLCSGRLPVRLRDRDTGAYTLSFRNVPPGIAEQIASSLGQRLRED